MVFRRRLIFWLFKAYIKRWGKVIILSFFLGLTFFFAMVYASKSITQVIPITHKTKIGVIGAYTVDTMHPKIVEKISLGLTRIATNGQVEPGMAQSWEIRDEGKTFVFHIKEGQKFNDGRDITSDVINYSFSNVQVERPDKYTIIYKLKDSYAPFLITVSRPIFHKGYVGMGEYRIDDVELNGNFLKNIRLVSTHDKRLIEEYSFYPSEQALKIAFAMGEVNAAIGLSDDSFKDTRFAEFPKVSASKVTNKNLLVTLFYNTQDPVLSDKRIRNALNYALPAVFPQGERSHLPYPSQSQFINAELVERVQDIDHALALLDTVKKEASGSAATQTVTIKTLAKYKDTAEYIKNAWGLIGLETKIEEVDRVPESFQIYLGDFVVSKDPDQYTLWHSAQQNNITKYKNLRIDKLLEDGRKTVDFRARKEIYDNFQKYLLDDSPASFLYFPQEIEIKRS
jgi:peptide/nickel transport system substrate-binding protein